MCRRAITSLATYHRRGKSSVDPHRHTLLRFGKRMATGDDDTSMPAMMTKTSERLFAELVKSKSPHERSAIIGNMQPYIQAVRIGWGCTLGLMLYYAIRAGRSIWEIDAIGLVTSGLTLVALVVVEYITRNLIESLDGMVKLYEESVKA